MCKECKQSVHVTCLGLSRNAYPAGVFTCAMCVRFDAKLPADASEQATDAAHTLVWLKGNRVRESSQHTYASGLHRYVNFWVQHCNKPIDEVLPQGDEGLDKLSVQLFIAWASRKYKVATIQSTLSALIDWHKSKGAPYDAISCQETKQVLETVKVQQGPAGIPVGKTGMTRPILRLLLHRLHKQRLSHPSMSALYLRDICWLLIGYFGMLRRSEIIALKLRDVVVGRAAGKPYVELTIRKSKTDQKGEGAVVTIAGVSKDNIRVADMLSEWLQLRAALHPSADDALFTAWDLNTYSLTNTPIATGQALALRLRKHLTELKCDHPEVPVNPKSYGMHSLRRGGVMAAWKAGVEVEKIKAHGRWRSDAIKTYMHTTRQMRLQVTTSM